jgi:hypothetical protein
MMTRQQWSETVRALRRAGGRTIILPRHWLFPEETAYLRSEGFVAEREASGLGIVEFVKRGR